MDSCGIRQMLLSSLLLAAPIALANEPAPDESVVARGKYIVQTSGCNDCHTPNYPESGGETPVSEWLVGHEVGFQGPWGTTYPANLRLYVQEVTEAEWIDRARHPMRPPMPWFSLRDMTENDLAAVYQFIRSLGPAGKPAPRAAGPGEQVATPYFEFVPKNLPKQAKAGH